jgi:hypothetical protein
VHTSQRAGLCISALLVGLALVTTEAIRSGCRLIAWLMRLFIMNLKVGLSADQGSLLSGLVFIDLVMRGTLLALGDDLGSLIDAAGRFSLHLRVLTRLVDDVLLHLLLMLLQHVVRHGALVRRISPLHQWMMVPIQSSLLLLLLFVLGPSAHMGRGRGLVGGEGCRRCGSVRVSGIRAHRWDVVVGLRAVTACARGHLRHVLLVPALVVAHWHARKVRWSVHGAIVGCVHAVGCGRHVAHGDVASWAIWAGTSSLLLRLRLMVADRVDLSRITLRNVS